MALSATVANPFRLSGCSLPPALVLLCRLVALALLVTNHQQQMQTPFLPFLPVFDLLPPEPFQWALRIGLVVSCLGVLFTRQTRLFAAVAGTVMLLAVASSRAYYGNNKTFTGLLLILASLSEQSGPARLITWQLALVYGGAGINKLLDPDWQSGQFFHYWASERLQNPAYLGLTHWVPGLVAGKIFCWYSIVAELTLCVLLLLPRQRKWALWGSGLFQSGLLLFTGDPFNLFFYSMQISLLSLADWPKEPILVIWDGSCGFCRRSKEIFAFFDADGLFNWQKLQSGIGERFGLANAQLKQAMYAAGDGWLLSGYRAWRRMVLHLPQFWMTLVVALAFAPSPNSRRALCALVLFFLLPISNPIGNAVYGWIARHRHELLAGETCEL